MQTNEKVPVTKVTRVSDMRTLANVNDDSLLLVVQDGKGWKIKYSALKKLILDDAIQKSKSFQEAEASKIQTKMSKLENNVEELSSNLQKKSGKYSLPEIQSNLKQLSAKVNYDFNELSNASTNFFTNAEADNLKNEVLKIKNTAQNKLSSLDNDITNVRSTIDESKKTIQQLSVDFNIASNVVENKIQQQQQSIQNVKKYTDDIKDELIDKLTSANSGIEEANKDNQNQFKNISAFIKDLNYKIVENSKTINMLNSLLQTLKTDMQACKDLQNNLSNDMKKIEAKEDQKLQELDGKLFGVSTQQRQPNGTLSTTVLQTGLLDDLSSALSSLSTSLSK